MNFTVGNVRITVSFLLAVGLCAGTLLPGHLLPLLWLAILLHECGHFIYIAAAGKKIGVICISLTGVRIKLAGDRMSRGQELLLNLSGPTVNLLFGQHNADRKINAVYASSSSTLGRGVCHIAAAGQ